MNRLISRLLAFVAVTQVGAVSGAMALSSSSVAPDEEAWQQTVATNTLEAYAKFSLDFPESQHARAARLRLSGPRINSVNADIDQIDDQRDTAAPVFMPHKMMIAY